MSLQDFWVFLLLFLRLSDVCQADGATNGVIAFEKGSITVDETAGSIPIKVVRTGATAGSFVVIVAINESAAKADFVSTAKNLLFGDGDTEKTATFEVIDDDVPEDDETFTIEMTVSQSAPAVPAYGSPRSLLLTVTKNDDPNGIVRFDTKSVVVHEMDVASPARFTVTRDRGQIGDVTIAWEIANPGSNFVNSTGSVTISNGQSEGTLTIEVAPDDEPEPEKQFTVRLTRVTAGGATLNSTQTALQATLIIPFNDSPIRFSSSTYTTEEGLNAVLNVTRGVTSDGRFLGSESVAMLTTVAYATRQSGTATSNQDYTAVTDTITFAVGESWKLVTIAITDDPTPEASETFSVDLLSTTPGTVLVSPRNATVTIKGSDYVSFASSSSLTIDEDSVNRSARVDVVRTGGVDGRVEVRWEVRETDDGALATSEFVVASSSIVFGDGVSAASIVVAVRSDVVPEVARRFNLTLVTVTGNARLAAGADEGATSLGILVPDNDDAYGVIDLAPNHTISNNPRELRVRILRSGGLIGDISVSYSTVYFPKGAGSSGGIRSFVASSGTVEFRQGVREVTTSDVIASDAFLEVGSSFNVTLTGVSLRKAVSNPVPKSPRLGDAVSGSVIVTPSSGNGAVGFALSTATASEPEDLNIVITREGAYGKASITWVVRAAPDSSFSPVDDVASSTDTVVLNDGDFQVSFVVKILADNVAELEEQFDVELTSIAEGLPQRIDSARNSIRVTILPNGNPGGVFRFSNRSQGPFSIAESIFAFQILFIERIDGSLTDETLEYVIVGGDNDFNDPRGKLPFLKGITSGELVVSPVDDNVPEINESFSIELKLPSSSMARLGHPSTVNITIARNDDPNGVIRFAPNSLAVTIDETPNGALAPTSASLIVQRDRGLFGSVSVRFNVTARFPSYNVDSQLAQAPMTGVLDFPQDVDEARITLSSLPDDITETAQIYDVALHSATGGAKLSSRPLDIAAVFTIAANDDEIEFASSAVDVDEGATLNLTVLRLGRLSGEAVIRYQIVDTTAASGMDYQDLSGGLIRFADGVDRQFISIRIVNDSVAEDKEVFSVSLVFATGDVVLGGQTQVDVTIIANDDTNVIQFADSSLSETVEEGSTAKISVDRLRTTAGRVSVLWAVVNSKTDALSPSGEDFVSTTGVLVFKDEETQATISLDAIADGLPELDEKFTVRLTAILPNRTQITRLGSQLSANVTISKNDDANGVIHLDDRMVNLPEDADSGGVTPGSVNVSVSRQRGLFGEVKALWSVYPRNLTNLARFVDLLFVTQLGEGVVDVSEKDRRPGSETASWSFDGRPFVSGGITPVSEHPAVADIASGFTISTWVKPAGAATGVLLMKGDSEDIGTRYYGLTLANRTNSQLAIVFDYLPGDQKSGFESVEAVIPQSPILDGQWHHIAVSVGPQAKQGQADFYLDGKLRSSKVLQDVQVADDSDGDLVVGARLDGILNYVGLMQDLRIYSNQLTSEEIATIGTDRLALAFTPVAGVVTFPAGFNQDVIQFTATSDLIPEMDEFFTLSLQETTGDAALNTTTTEILLMRSDNANGLFRFSNTSRLVAPGEPAQIKITVERQKGTFGTANVDWDVRQILPNVDPYPLASTDFDQPSGTLVFKPNVAFADLVLNVTADRVPELDENFVVTLLSASPADGHVGSSSTSDASVDPTRNALNATVEKNDDPYGVLEFTVDVPPSPADPTTVPATIAPEIQVDETDGTVTLTVVRANGLNGVVNVEYRTADGSAVSGKDYAAAAGRLVFADQERFKQIAITLIDNGVPELEKVFSVRLENQGGVSGKPVLGVGKDINIRIQPSDDAFGVVAFSRNSLSVSTNEMTAPVALNVQRTGGTLGPIVVYWEAEQQNAAHDLSPSMGNVTLDTGVQSATISVVVRQDSLPELDELFTIRLVSVSGGGALSTAGDVVSTISVSSSDDPHGVFVFTPGNRPLRVVEANRMITLTVIREFGTIGSVDVEWETITSSPSRNIAAAQFDYLSNFGRLSFADGDREKTLNITVNDDNIPELDESFFVRLISSTLTGGQTSNNTFPRIGSPEGTAQVVILENDDARGVMELSTPALTVAENVLSVSFLSVRRREGTFGNATVSWTATDGSAKGGFDYSPNSGSVVFQEGESTAFVPLRIVNDQLPEFNEDFTVRLTDAGAARLGSQTVTTVTIEQNDDPNGAFEFSDSSLNFVVDEPDVGSTRITFTLKRSGGSTGVVSVHYEATIDGVLATNDVNIPQKDIFFLSGQFSTTFSLEILADDDREARELLMVNLTSATMSVPGIPRIGTNRLSVVEIRGNDAPHGFFEFNQTQYVVDEQSFNAYVLLSLERTLGLIGAVQVAYQTRRIENSVQAANIGQRSLEFFSSPILGRLLSSYNQPPPSSFTLEGCAAQCLDEPLCLSFSFSGTTKACERHTQYRTDSGANFQSDQFLFLFYEKNMTMIRREIDRTLASDSDYGATTSGVTVVPDGVSVAYINVTIKPDDVPELGESFHVVLTGVSLVSGPADKPANEPALGKKTTATLTIPLNDHPFGLFKVVSVSGKNVADVEEKTNFTVDLVVERSAGRFGDVEIEWFSTNVTAESGKDYLAPGAKLRFIDGDFQKFARVTVLNDDIPEDNETLRVELRNPTNGAAISPSSQYATVTILANDDVAGVFRLAADSRSAIVAEGTTFNMTVERTKSAVGSVDVYWRIEGNKTDDEFEATSSFVSFAPGQTLGRIALTVKADSQPELREVYTLRLYDVRTMGVSPSGAAILSASESTASLTIGASDDPHGTVQFDSGSLRGGTPEGDSDVTLTIVRQFGSIGDITVFYKAVEGSTSPLVKDELALASTPSDFVSQLRNVSLADGVKSANVVVRIKEDSVPELDEAFLVDLTSVILVSNVTTGTPPRLGSDSTAEVVIEANDGTAGEITFALASQTISEDIGGLRVEILRNKGTFGTVGAFVEAIEDGAKGQGVDFTFSPDSVQFNSGENSTTIIVPIKDDNDPELDESFTLRLTNPRDAVLGAVTTMKVTIRANDDPHGVISFHSSSLRQTVSEGSSFQLVVVRARGVSGDVVVPWNVSDSATSDLSPQSGTVTFKNGEMQAIISLTATGENVPELDETFTIKLGNPTGGALLSPSDTSATVTISANDDQHGVIAISGPALKKIEEDVGRVRLSVTRTGGLFGRVTCLLTTHDGVNGATKGQPINNTFSVVQTFSSIKVESLTLFNQSNNLYMLLASSNRTGPLEAISGGSGDGGGNVAPEKFVRDPGAESGLYRWNGGGFDRLQSIDTDGAMAWLTFPLGGGVFAAVANFGSRDRSVVTSRLYQLNGNAFEPTQDLQTNGRASDVATFVVAGVTYLVFANQENAISASTDTNSAIFKQDGVTTLFNFHGTIATKGATALETFVIANTQYLAVGNGFSSTANSADIDSEILQWSPVRETFSVAQRIQTFSVSDVRFFSAGGNEYLLFVNSKAGNGSLALYKWNQRDSLFQQQQTLPAVTPRSARTITARNELFLVFGSETGDAGVYRWNSVSETFGNLLSVPADGSNDVLPLVVGPNIYLVLGLFSRTLESSTVYLVTRSGPLSDYISREETLIFEEGVDSIDFYVEIENDTLPELDEEFTATLTNVMGGARLGTVSRATIDILTNDDAHGVISFASSSRSVPIRELNTSVSVVLNLTRAGGTFGEVQVAWSASGPALTDISPQSGTIVFLAGSDNETLIINILPDPTPELAEDVVITLTDVLGRGGVPSGSDLARGAKIDQTLASSVISVAANDNPHGVINWSPSSATVNVKEPGGVNSTISLLIIREFGAFGDLIVQYRTLIATSESPDRRATPDADFVFVSSSVRISADETSVTIPITIESDNIPELDEFFIVNLESVALTNFSGNAPSPPPSIGSNSEALIKIEENDDARGVLDFSLVRNNDGTVHVDEDIGTLSLSVRRTGGVFGTVGCSFSVTAGTALGNGVDFSQSSGTLRWSAGDVTKQITVKIIDDNVPEIDETFVVNLSSPTGGATLGSDVVATVTITQNDDANGRFSFDPVTSQVVSVAESTNATDPNGLVRLTVLRERGAFGTVAFDWDVEMAGRMDLSPVSGRLVFPQDVKSQDIFIRAVHDDIPESDESYMVTLTNITGGGVFDANKAAIFIRQNGDANGVVFIDSQSRFLALSEAGPGAAGRYSVKLNRSAGSFGTVNVAWKITPSDSNGFLSETGTVTFVPQQQNAVINLFVKPDVLPELSKTFTLTLETIQGGARFDADPKSTTATLLVAASDNPYGVVQFVSPFTRNVLEGVGQVSLGVERVFGSFGRLRINCTTNGSQPIAAAYGSDYTLKSYSIELADSQQSGSILVDVVDDAVPELTESLYVQLDLVELLSNPLNTSVVQGVQIDIPPAIGSPATSYVSILENDYPYGLIEFDVGSRQIDLTEDSGSRQLTLNRAGGTFGVVNVIYQARNMTAFGNGIDFDLGFDGNGTIVFLPGQTQASFNVTIVDDALPEIFESFSIRLVSALDGAVLGSATASVITIRANDDPSGIVGFTDVSLRGVATTNPSILDGNKNVNFFLSRTAGDVGRIEVTWELVGPLPGREHEDVTSTRGVAVINDRDRSGTITLTVVADDTAELAETFELKLTSIAGGATLDPARTNTTLTILLHGEPFGVIDFSGESLARQLISEPVDNRSSQTVKFPVQRTEGTVGDIVVLWKIANISRSSDISPLSGAVMIADGSSQGTISVSILPDALAELDRTYTVVLLNASGGAKIGVNDQALFTIRANDVPHGIFGIVSPRIVVTSNGGRDISFDIGRQLGTIGDVKVTYTMSYSQPTQTPYVQSVGEVVLTDGVSVLSVRHNVSSTAFLLLSESFTITLTAVDLLTPGADDIPPAKDSFTSTATAVVTSAVANSIVQFGDASFQLAVNDTTGNVAVTVSRRGTFGSLSVAWLAGLRQSGFANGSVVPSRGVLRFADRLASRDFSVRATPFTPHGVAEVFALQLTSVASSVEGGAILDANRLVARIEPHGVVQFSPSSRSIDVFEGTGAVVLTLWRLYGSEGLIEVSYATRNRSIGRAQYNAEKSVDFTPADRTIRLSSQQTTESFSITIIDNDTPEDDEVFYVDLLATQAVPALPSLLPSPRFDSFTRCTVTIKDDDDPRGIFTFADAQKVVTEEDVTGRGSRVVLRVQRKRGLFSRVSVVVRTFGGGEGWTNFTANRNVVPSSVAQVNVDYQKMNEVLVFDEGVDEVTATLVVYNDDVAEVDENIYVELVDPTDGSRIGLTSEYNPIVKITVHENDLPNGLIGFVEQNVVLNEDDSALSSVDVVVARDRGFFGAATVDWQVARTFGGSVDPEITSEFLTTSGSVQFSSNQKEATLKLALRADADPESAKTFIVYLHNPSAGSDIYNNRNVLNVTVEPSDSAFGVLQFSTASRVTAVSEDAGTVTLYIQRIGGSLGAVTVTYATRSATESDDLSIGTGGLQATAARAGTDYVFRSGTVFFAQGETLKSVAITLVNQVNPSTEIKVFYVTLTEAGGGATTGTFDEATVRITPVDASVELDVLLIEASLQSELTSTLIQSATQDLSDRVQSLSGTDSRELGIYLNVLEEVIEKGASMYTRTVKEQLLGIFNYMLENEKFTSQASIALTLQKFVFSLVSRARCLDAVNASSTERLEENSLTVQAMRATPREINGRKFETTEGNFITLPAGLVKQVTGDPAKCRDLYFIYMKKQTWFQDGDPLFNEEDGGTAQILSVGLNVSSSEVQNLENKVLYRINTERRVRPNSGECIYWHYQSGRWLTDGCSKKTQLVDQNFIECECDHLTDFGARGQTDDRVGWGIAIQVSCFFAMICFLLVWIVHYAFSCCRNMPMLISVKLLMHLVFAVFVTEIILVAAIYSSKTASAPECGAMGGLIHFFVVAQFAWMMVISINLWQTLVQGNDETDRYYLVYILLGWGTSAVVLALYMLIGFYAVNWNITVVYGDVHDNGDMCFITNIYGGLAGGALPIVICMLAMALVFTQAYQLPSRWKQYDDVYRNVDNKEEIPKLLLLFVLLFFTWLMAGLHLGFTTTTTAVFFVIFNIVTGLYVLFAYFFLRLRNVKERGGFYPNEELAEGAYPMTAMQPSTSKVSLGSHGSKRALVPEAGPWHGIPSESPPPPASPPGHVNAAASGEPDSPEFDDLIFALRTGGNLPPEEAGKGVEDDDDDDDDDDDIEKSKMTEHFEMRRISITDTRL